MSSESAIGQFQTVERELRKFLEDRKSSVVAEIRGYPGPIAGCDQQFNHLIELRLGISRDIDRLDDVLKDAPSPTEQFRAIASFVRSSPHIDDGTTRKILDDIATGTVP